MKDQMLKIAGVKSEKELYKLFPDEASFMAKHGKEFKKAKLGNAIPKNQNAQFVLPKYDMPRAASSSTAMTYNTSNGPVSSATTGQKKKDVAASTKAMGKAKTKEAKERKEKSAVAKSARESEKYNTSFTLPNGETKDYSDMNLSEKAYVAGLATEDMFNIDALENPDSNFSLNEYNPLSSIIGSMAGELGTGFHESVEQKSLKPIGGAMLNPLLAGLISGTFYPKSSSTGALKGLINPIKEAKEIASIMAASGEEGVGNQILKQTLKKGSKKLKHKIIEDIEAPPVKGAETAGEGNAGAPQIIAQNMFNPSSSLATKMFKHGGQLYKLQQLTDFGNPPIAADGSMVGSYMGGDKVQNSPTLNFGDYYNQALSSATGVSQEEREKQQAAQQAQASSKGGGGGMDISGMMGMASSLLGGGEGGEGGGMDFSKIAGMLGGGKRNGGPVYSAKGGKKVPKYQFSDTPVPLGGFSGSSFDWNPGAGGISGGGAPAAPALPGGNAAGMFQLDRNQTGTLQQQIAGSAGAIKPGGMDMMGTLSKMAGPVGGIIQGIQGLKNEKKQLKDAEMAQTISGLSLKASESRREESKRRYRTPWDNPTQPNQMSPSNGVGTNPLAKNGRMIGGNPGEIQNTYAPNNLYDDLGYEPLSDSEIVKQYRAGGFIRRGQSGLSQFASAGGGDLTKQLIGGVMGGDNAGSQLGSTIGSTAGMIFGPVGSLVGGAVGQVAGKLLDKNTGKIKDAQEAAKKNVEKAGFQSGIQGLQGQNSAFVRDGGNIPQHEEGGWVSHDWQPQVITQFGEHSMKDLLRHDDSMDTLRTGGHIRQNNMSSIDQYALGGELKTTWGGHAETLSHNPYMPGSGETVMFRGKSHEEGDGNGHTGIGVKYGDGGQDSYTDYAEYGSENADADVEVERGEPAAEMIDGQTGEKNMVVYGNLKINKASAAHIGDKNAENKKFKTYVDFLGKVENKQNKIIEKATEKLNNLDVQTPFQKLTFDALNASIIGGNMNLKDVAVKKANAAAVQNAINDTAAEHGLSADHLALGKIKQDKEAMKQQARFGKEIFKAQTGTTATPGLPDIPQKDYEYLKGLYDAAQKQGKGDAVKKFQKEYHRLVPDYAKSVIGEYPATTHGGKNKPKLTNKDLTSNEDGIFGKRTKRYMAKLDSAKKKSDEDYDAQIPLVDIGGWDSGDDEAKPAATTAETTTLKPVEALKRNPWIDAAGELLPYFRPSDQEDFDTSQLYPEMAAIAMNQLEPVQAELYHPDLGTPMDISLQDQLNANQADFNAIQRQTGYNPAAQATLAGQKYEANTKVLGEQFRLNQAEKQRVYEGNRALLNDAQFKNLGILDTQMTRQETAKSKTKEQALEAIKSMSDKIAKNKLENRTLGIYENMYNYRFGKSGKAQNWNPLAQFDVEASAGKAGSAGAPEGYEYETILKKKKKSEEADKSRNGSIVKAIKNL